MTTLNHSSWSKLEVHRDAIHCNLQLLNNLLGIQQQQGIIPDSVVESLRVGIESALTDCESLEIKMKHLLTREKAENWTGCGSQVKLMEYRSMVVEGSSGNIFADLGYRQGQAFMRLDKAIPTPSDLKRVTDRLLKNGVPFKVREQLIPPCNR